MITSRVLVYDIEMANYSSRLKVAGDGGYRHLPSAEANLMGVSVATNSLGLRGEEPSDKAQKILFLGDSLTLGWGVAQESTFASILGERIQRLYGYQTLNGGHGNYNSSQELNLLKELAPRLRPKQVFLFYFLNDAEPAQFRPGFSWLGRSRFLSLLWSVTRRVRSAGGEFEEYYHSLYRSGAPGWNATRAAILEMKTYLRKNNTGFAVILLPDFHRLDPYPFKREHDLLGEFLREAQIPYIDLAQGKWEHKGGSDLWVAKDDAHPNAKGHKLIAEGSWQFLVERLDRLKDEKK